MFNWTPRRRKAASLLSDGYTIKEVAQAVKVSTRSIDFWKHETEFASEVDRLTMETGIAQRSERIKIVKQLTRQKLINGLVITDKDLLDWLKFAQSETTGEAGQERKLNIDVDQVEQVLRLVYGNGANDKVRNGSE